MADVTRRRFVVAGGVAVMAGALMATVTVAARSTATSAVTMVEIKSEHLIGLLPIGLLVDVNVKVKAEGDDPSSLSGEGRHFASTGAHNYWPATGSIIGDVVSLDGAVTESNVFFLVGSPVQVVGDASTGAITLTFGPLFGGPFAGQTLTFSGTGKVTVTVKD